MPTVKVPVGLTIAEAERILARRAPVTPVDPLAVAARGTLRAAELAAADRAATHPAWDHAPALRGTTVRHVHPFKAGGARVDHVHDGVDAPRRISLTRWRQHPDGQWAEHPETIELAEHGDAEIDRVPPYPEPQPVQRWKHVVPAAPLRHVHQLVTDGPRVVHDHEPSDVGVPERAGPNARRMATHAEPKG